MIEQIKKNIVLIEDSSFIRSLVKHSLSEQGFSVYEVANGASILNSKKFNPSIPEPGIVDKIKPDLFILDIELEDINGLDLLKRLKGHTDFKNTPVIVNSSHSDRETIVRAITAGAADYVLKEDNFVKVLTDKIGRFFKKELSSFEATLARELDWIRYGNKELAFALIGISYKDKIDDKVKTEIFENAMTRIKQNVRHYDWLFFIEGNLIAVILPLATIQDIVILRRRLLDIIEDFQETMDHECSVQIGFSHFPTSAQSAEDMITIAKKQIK